MKVSSNSDPLPVTGSEHDGELASLRALHRLFEPAFNVREERKTDLGVDGTIEIGRYDPGSKKRIWTNLRAYFQIKHTSKPRFLGDGSLSYPLEVKNLNYLNSHQLPALYFVLDYTKDALYMRWHRDIVRELDAKNPNWLSQKTVDVHFSQLVTHDILSGIEAEIEAHAAMALSLADGPGLRRNFSGENPPDALYPHYPFVGRESEMHTLKTQIKPNSITVVCGVSGAGKTECLAHLLKNREATDQIRGAFSKPIALLVVNLKPQFGNHSVFRNLAYALGVSKLNGLSEMNWDEVGSEADARSRLVSQVFPSMLHGQSIVGIFENSQNAVDDSLQLQELEQILASDVFRDGVALVVSFRELSLTGENRRVLKPPVHFGNLPPADAETLITKIIGDADLVAAAVNIVRTIPEVLIPGAIIRGIGIFERLGNESKSGEALADALLDEYEPLIKEFLLEAHSLEADSAATNLPGVQGFAALAILTIFGKFVINQELLDKAGLELPPLPLQIRDKWIATTSDGYKMTEAAQFIVKKELKLVFQDPKKSYIGTELRAALNRFVESLKHSALLNEKSQKPLEEALSFLRQTAPNELDLQDRLSSLFLPYVVDDLIFPFSESESLKLSARLRETEDSQELESQVAQLVTASRFETNRVTLLQQLRRVTDLALISDRLSAVHIRALDITASLLARHNNLDKEIIDIRQTLITRLFLKAHHDNYENVEWIKWTSSWALNTVELLIRSGQLSHVGQLLEDIAGLLETLPIPTSQRAIVDQYQLWIRFKRLEAKVTDDQTERLCKLREALVFAREYIAFSTDQEHAISLYLRIVRRLIDEVPSDTERTAHVEEALNEVAHWYGNRQEWPLYAVSPAAALIRHEAGLHADPEKRVERLQDAVNLLAPFSAIAKLQASEGDNRSLLTLARCYAYLSTTHEQLGNISEATRSFKQAKDLTSEVVKQAPSSEAWILLLSLQDQQDHSSLDRPSNDTLMLSRTSISRSLGDLMKKALTWAYGTPAPGTKEGSVVFWCVQRNWGAEGSLEGHAANLPDLEKSWTTLNSTRKTEIISAIYKERMRKLDKISRRFGISRDLSLARAVNEAQYQKFIALQGTHEFNSDAVLAILNIAASVWPHDPLIIAAEGRLHRLFWNYADAITSFRRVRAMSADAELRRGVTVSLVETFISASIYDEIVDFPDGTFANRNELLAQARSLLAEIVGFRDVAIEASILSDRVEFEAGGEIDWAGIDAAYELVIGGVDRYLDTIVRNLDELLLEQPEVAKNLAEVLRENCTKIEVLQGLGSLYLRRAETSRSDIPVRDCERAYATFNACRILERSWYGAETALTKFRRARAILAAASQANNVDPFPVSLGRRKTSLDLAESLLDSVISQSVGKFYSVALQRKQQFRDLRKRLKHTNIWIPNDAQRPPER